MSARGNPLPPGMLRHGPPPVSGSSSIPPELAEKELAAQIADIDHLLTENRRLATSEVALRQDLIRTHDEVERLRAHIRSTQTENDIQTRVLMDKIAKMESDLEAGESIKKELDEAHKEAQCLVVARRELTSKIQQAHHELEECQIAVKMIPDLLSELDSMKLEHQKLRSTFEHEKSLNLDLVENLQAMERKLIGMMREVEKLRVEVSNAEKRAQAPYVSGAYPTPTTGTYPTPTTGAYPTPTTSAYPTPTTGAYPTPTTQYPPHTQTNGPYYHPYGHGHTPMSGSSTPTMEGSSAPPPMPWGGGYGSNVPGK